MSATNQSPSQEYIDLLRQNNVELGVFQLYNSRGETLEICGTDEAAAQDNLRRTFPHVAKENINLRYLRPATAEWLDAFFSESEIQDMLERANRRVHQAKHETYATYPNFQAELLNKFIQTDIRKENTIEVRNVLNKFLLYPPISVRKELFLAADAPKDVPSHVVLAKCFERAYHATLTREQYDATYKSHPIKKWFTTSYDWHAVRMQKDGSANIAGMLRRGFGDELYDKLMSAVCLDRGLQKHTLQEYTNMHDFRMGLGVEPAHRHANGGGWVADTAQVDSTVYVGPKAEVFGKARVTDQVRIEQAGRVYGNARVSGNVQIAENARVYGNAVLSDQVQVFGEATVSENAHLEDSVGVMMHADVFGKAHLSGNVIVSHHARVSGNVACNGSEQFSGETLVYDEESLQLALTSQQTASRGH